MPWSSNVGKNRIQRWMQGIANNEGRLTVLDVGAGAGAYATLLWPVDPRPVIDAVEVFEPYVNRFQLKERYRHVFVADARDFLLSAEAQKAYDVIILGDVLEHMSTEDATRLWEDARKAAKIAVIASVPLGEYPQGEEEGNVYEAHLSTWIPGDVYRLGGVAQFHEWYSDTLEPNDRVGVYMAAALPEPAGALPPDQP